MKEYEIIEIEDMFQKKSYAIRDVESCRFVDLCNSRENAEELLKILEEDSKVFGTFD